MPSILVGYMIFKMDSWLSQSVNKSIVIGKKEFVDFLQFVKKLNNNGNHSTNQCSSTIKVEDVKSIDHDINDNPNWQQNDSQNLPAISELECLNDAKSSDLNTLGKRSYANNQNNFCDCTIMIKQESNDGFEAKDELSVIKGEDYSSNKTEIYLIGSNQNTEIQLHSVEHQESDKFPEAEVGEKFASASNYVAGSKGQQLRSSKRSRVESDKDNPYMKIIDSTEKEDEVIEVIHVEDSLLPPRKAINTKDKSPSISSDSTRICRNEQVLRRNPPRRARPTFSSTDADLGDHDIGGNNDINKHRLKPSLNDADDDNLGSGNSFNKKLEIEKEKWRQEEREKRKIENRISKNKKKQAKFRKQNQDRKDPGEEQGDNDKHHCFAQGCRRKFGTNSALDNHILGRHLKQWQNKCIGCYMDFSCMNSRGRYRHRCLCIKSKYPYIDMLRKII